MLGAFPGVPMAKSPCSQCRERGFDPRVGKIPCRREWPPHANILAWRIPWTEEPGRLQSMGSLHIAAATAAKSLQSCPILCDPHRWQPTRLLCPWDSPGKNTGVGCHFLLQCMKVKSKSEVSQSCLLATPWTAAYQAPPSMGFSRQEYRSGVPLPSPQRT